MKSASEGRIADADGWAFFGRAETLDWFQLRHADSRRAVFAYDRLGALTSSRWINP